MKTLGILGGIGPESTVQYYKLIVAGYRARNPDGSFPPVLINSIDMTRMLGLIGANQMKEVTKYLADEVNRLARAGAEVALMAANTPHIVFHEIQERAHIPMLSIVQATCDAARQKGMTRLALFGTRFTMQGSFYPEVFSRHGVELVTPDKADQDYIHDKYMRELVHGQFLDETRRHLLGIVDRLIDERQVQGLILGGTELPLILTDESYRGIALLDTTRIHVERAVRSILS